MLAIILRILKVFSGYKIYPGIDDYLLKYLIGSCKVTLKYCSFDLLKQF